MGARMRALDWSKTPLGPVDAWPQSLRSTVSMLLPVQGADHPVLGSGIRRALQRRVPSGLRRQTSRRRSVFPGARHGARSGTVSCTSCWPASSAPARRSGPRICSSSSSATGFRRRPTSTSRTIPVRVESGEVGGVYCIVTETTERVVGERRLALLKESRRAQCHRAHAARRLRPGHRDARREAAGRPVRAHVSR